MEQFGMPCSCQVGWEGIHCAGLLSFRQHWFISRGIRVPQKTTGHSRDWFLGTILCLEQVAGKCENHRESLEQSLRWDEPRCICQLYGQMIMWILLLNRSLVYDSEDRSAWWKFGEGRRLCRGCPGALRRTEQQLLLQGCAAARGYFLSQSTSVLPGIPAVGGVLLLSYSSLEVCCEEGQTSPASRSQLYLHSSKNKEKGSRAQSFSTQPVRILKRRGDKPPRASFPLQLLSNLFSCLFKCFALGNWGSISPRI